MNTFAVIQTLIIGVLVLGSAAYAFRKLLPGLSTRLLAGASANLNKPWRPRILQRLGKRLQPAAATGSCGDGCGSCGTCGPTPPKQARPDVQPLEFRPRRH